MPPQLCLPQYEGQPFQKQPPDIDGYVEPEAAMVWAFGTAAAQVDVGWTGAGRITYGPGAEASPGAPLVVLQGVSDTASATSPADRRLYLSFIVRRDPGFDNADRIVLVLHPEYAVGSAGKDGRERRIDIAPVTSDVGAGTAAGVSEFGMLVKGDRTPRDIETYRWDTASGSWQQLDHDPPGLEVRVRSWTTGPGGNNWSIEVAIPATTSAPEGASGTAAAAAAAWIDLTDRIGLYANVVRVSRPDPSLPPMATQFTWPRGGELDDQGGLVPLSELPIEPSLLGEAVVGSGSACAGIRGVAFDGAWGAIGARAPGSGAAPTSAIQPGSNEFVARLRNTAGPASDVTAEFRIANWGIGPGTSPLWNALVPDSGWTNPSTETSLAAGTPTSPTVEELVTRWTPDPALYGSTLDDHQCIWVLLDSLADVDFVRASAKRNMQLFGLSEVTSTPQIDGRGWAEKGERSRVGEFVLHVSHIAVARQRDGGSTDDQRRRDEQRPGLDHDELQRARLFDHVINTELKRDLSTAYEQVFIVCVDGYRRTPRTITIGKERIPIYTYTDSFGQIGVHDAAQPDGLVVELGGHGLERLGRHGYRLEVPNDGAVRLKMRTATTPGRRPDDRPEDPRDPKDPEDPKDPGDPKDPRADDPRIDPRRPPIRPPKRRWSWLRGRIGLGRR